MKNLFIVAFSAMIMLASCSKKQETTDTNNHNIPLSSKNPKAIAFFRAAEKHKFDQEFIEAKEDYRSALRLDPNMILALTEINEDNINVALEYRRRAVRNFKNSNEFERIFVEWDTIVNTNEGRIKKRELSRKVIELYPDKIDGYLMMGQSFNYWNEESKEAITFFKKALEIDPQNAKATANYLRCIYGGSRRSVRLKNDSDFYNQFDLEAKSLAEKFPESLRILSSIAEIYRNSYNFSDESRIQKTLAFYNKCQEIVNETGSSFKNSLLTNIARVSLLTGDNDKAISMLETSLKDYEGNSQLIAKYFRLFLAHLYNGNYLGAIKSIDEFDNFLESSDFTKEELLKSKVGLNNFKAIIYAHANQKDRALKSLDIYKKHSDSLVKFYNLKGDIHQQLRSVPGLGFVRWREASPQGQLWHEIWINIMVGNFNTAELLQDNFEKTYGNRQTHWDGIMNILQGNSEKGYNIIERNNLGYMQYFKSQALISLGEKEKAKPVLDSVRQLPEGNIFNNLVVKRAANLYNQL